MPDQGTEIIGRLDGIERHLARLETALIGDKAVGHKGLVPRVETLELINAETPAVHAAIEERAREARAKLHGRIDDLEEETSARIATLFDQWNRLKYTAVGISIGIGLVGGVSGAMIASLFG